MILYFSRVRTPRRHERVGLCLEGSSHPYFAPTRIHMKPQRLIPSGKLSAAHPSERATDLIRLAWRSQSTWQKRCFIIFPLIKQQLCQKSANPVNSRYSLLCLHKSLIIWMGNTRNLLQSCYIFPENVAKVLIAAPGPLPIHVAAASSVPLRNHRFSRTPPSVRCERPPASIGCFYS